MVKYELTNYQWSLIKPLIPPKTSTCGRARRDPRQLFRRYTYTKDINNVKI